MNINITEINCILTNNIIERDFSLTQVELWNWCFNLNSIWIKLNNPAGYGSLLSKYATQSFSYCRYFLQWLDTLYILNWSSLFVACHYYYLSSFFMNECTCGRLTFTSFYQNCINFYRFVPNEIYFNFIIRIYLIFNWKIQQLLWNFQV